MQTAVSIEELTNINDNQVIIKDDNSLVMSDSTIRFEGKNNILFLDSRVNLEKVRLTFAGSNSIIYLSRSSHKYRVDATVYHNSVLFFGEDIYFNNTLKMILSEHCHIIIGRQCLFSTDIWLRTADPHLIYNIDTYDRINNSKSIFIGDHVWVGQHALLLKGTHIHSGSIIGAQCVLAGKSVPSNVSFAGNPGRQVAEHIFWDEKVVHKWKRKDTKAHSHYTAGDEFVFKNDSAHTITFSELEKNINKCASVDERLELILSLNQDKNRFAYTRPQSNLKGLKSLKHKFRLWMKKKLLRIL